MPNIRDFVLVGPVSGATPPPPYEVVIGSFARDDTRVLGGIVQEAKGRARGLLDKSLEP
jgi:hypothetical protein